MQKPTISHGHRPVPFISHLNKLFHLKPLFMLCSLQTSFKHYSSPMKLHVQPINASLILLQPDICYTLVGITCTQSRLVNFLKRSPKCIWHNYIKTSVKNGLLGSRLDWLRVVFCGCPLWWKCEYSVFKVEEIFITLISYSYRKNVLYHVLCHEIMII